MPVGFLARRECAVVEPVPSASRGKMVRLTQKGERAQSKYRRVLDETEAQLEPPGSEPTSSTSLAALARERPDRGPTAAGSPLARGLEPYPDGWRASVRRPAVLPQYPMVLHRGG